MKNNFGFPANVGQCKGEKWVQIFLSEYSVSLAYNVPLSPCVIIATKRQAESEWSFEATENQTIISYIFLSGIYLPLRLSADSGKINENFRYSMVIFFVLC